ncbi:MAG: M23 family metallopeptidase [Bacteroidales bacterium]|jgi:biotin carboxyl carrier protein|nr:M23 family metallopeptidase [Bacteroidales bacterium]
MNFKNIKFFWKKLRKYWTHRFRLIIRNEENLSDVFVLKLTPRRIFVLGVVFSLIIIMLTAILIAFTPLRVYVPGYTSPIEYKLYKQMLIRVDSIERLSAMQKIYLDNFFNVLSDKVISEEMNAPMENVSEKRIKDQERAEKAFKQVNEAAEKISIEITDRSSKSYISLYQNVSYPTFAFTMPAPGNITKLFSIPDKHFGIDIENEKGTLVTAVADGVVISIESAERESNIFVQHSGNIVSQYKNLDLILKKVGDKVKSGDPIATMGNRGKESQKPYLHFEIWYNGTPLNPIENFLQ